MTVWTWYACDLRTGLVATQLPLTTDRCGKLLSGIGGGSIALPVTDPECPSDWENAVIEERSLLVAEATNDTGSAIMWAGIVTDTRTNDGATVSISCETVEHYLTQRYVDAKIATTSWDQHQLFADLIGHANTSGIGITIDAPLPSGQVRPFTTYERYADQQIYQSIQDLATLENGPEWVIETRWAPGSPRRVEHIAHARTPYYGAVTAEPEWRFESGHDGGQGNVLSWERARSGPINVVVAGGQGDGPTRIMSTSAIAQDSGALAAGWPLLEYRHATQLETRDTVDAAALGELATRRRGVVTYQVRLQASALPLNQLWGLGDTAELRLYGPAAPNGIHTLARITGWEISPAADEIAPTLIPWEM